MKNILDFFDAFLISLDGIIYNKILQRQAREIILQIRKAGKTFRLLSNNPNYPRKLMYSQLQNLGIETTLEEIIAPDLILKTFLKLQKLDKIYFLGSRELKKELLEANIKIVQQMPQVVVASFDEKISFKEIKKVANLIKRGTPLIATNPEYQFSSDESIIPTTGVIVEVLEKITSFRAIHLGKPNPFFFLVALESLPSKNLRCVVIGDNPQTDIIGAHWMGIPAILVAQRFRHFSSRRDPRNPELWIKSFKELEKKRVEELAHGNKTLKVLPDGIKVATCGMVFDRKKQILLVLKKNSKKWGLPTGTMEVGETLIECLQREIYEETGINIDPTSATCKGVFTDPEKLVFAKELGKPFQFVVVVYRCKALNNKPFPDGEEIEKAKFFPLDRLPPNLFEIHREWIQRLLTIDER